MAGRWRRALVRRVLLTLRVRVLSVTLRGVAVDRIVDGPLRFALERLGELWLDDPEQGIFREHRATQI